MKRSICDQVAERVALGEPLEELAGHVMTCEACQGLVAVSSKLSAAHHPVDPGLGFTARMTVGAQHRLAVRRRNRLTVGLLASVACGAFGVFVVTRSPDVPQTAVKDETTHSRPTLAPPSREREPVAQNPDEDTQDADLAALAQFADTEHNRRLSADWSSIERPLTPYKKLLKGVTP
jgi:hypothetical protein